MANDGYHIDNLFRFSSCLVPLDQSSLLRLAKSVPPTFKSHLAPTRGFSRPGNHIKVKFKTPFPPRRRYHHRSHGLVTGTPKPRNRSKSYSAVPINVSLLSPFLQKTPSCTDSFDVGAYITKRQVVASTIVLWKYSPQFVA